tara:strand:- start:972 stop:1559 length:588 start_codon:yes stop_codon:yes gene_type:complete
MRARLAIVAAGYNCELREVVLRSKPAAMLDASPKGTVPVMILDSGTVLEESLDIMHWALGENDPEEWLSKQVNMALIDTNDGAFKGNLDRYKYPNRFGLVSGIDYRERAFEYLNSLEGLLETTPFISGNSFGFDDAAVLPFVRQFANVDRAWWDSSAPLTVRHWLASFLESERYRSIMPKYKPWQDGTTGILFPG